MFIRQIIGIVGNSKKSLAYYTLLVCDHEFTTPCWFATSSLLHLNQFQGGGQGSLAPSPQYANGSISLNKSGSLETIINYYVLLYVTIGTLNILEEKLESGHIKFAP